jgi:hypothetical protein
MARRIDIELTSRRDDDTWTWRAAGAREPRGTVDSGLLPEGSNEGDVFRAELEGFIDGIQVVSVVPPKPTQSEPERIELLGPPPGESTDGVSVPPGRKERRPRRAPAGGRDASGRGQGRRRGKPTERGASEPARQRRGDSSKPAGRANRGRATNGAAADRKARPSEQKPKPRRLRPAKVQRTRLLESLPAEERPIAEQLLHGGIPAVRDAIRKQNEELRTQGKPEVNADALLQIAERLRPQALAATWRDRAAAALAQVDDLDLRDLRSVVNAADDARRDADARDVASKLREALAQRVEKEHAAWIAEIADNMNEGRVVRALRLSSRPPKAGSPLPPDVAERLVAAAGSALTAEISAQRWATVLDALAFSPIRRRVVPQSLPAQLSPELHGTITRLATRLPEIAHIFNITADESRQSQASRRGAAGRRRRPDGETAASDGESSSHDSAAKIGAMG